MRLVRHYDQDEKRKRRRCSMAFDMSGKNSRSQIDFNTCTKEATERGSSVARIPEISYCTFALIIQGHTCGNLIALELTGHVAIPSKCHRIPVSSRMLLRCAIHPQIRTHRWRMRRQTIFFTPLNPFWDKPDGEEPSNELCEPRKVHYDSKWKTRQVYWMNFARTQDKGQEF